MKKIKTLLSFFYNDSIDWHCIYEQNLPLIFHYFCYKVGDQAVAEDLTAMTFEKAWTKRDQYDPAKGEILTWMMRIARNVTIDYFRKKEEGLVSIDEGISAGIPSPDEVLEKKEKFERLQKILHSYPERERELIALKYGAGLTNREIAQLNGLSESNVGTILFRLISKLRSEWLEEEEGTQHER